MRVRSISPLVQRGSRKNPNKEKSGTVLTGLGHRGFDLQRGGSERYFKAPPTCSHGDALTVLCLHEWANGKLPGGTMKNRMNQALYLSTEMRIRSSVRARRKFKTCGRRAAGRNGFDRFVHGVITAANNVDKGPDDGV